jgi:hypothetical protein
MTIVNTIAPIFIIIATGFFIQRYGFLGKNFFEEANRFVFFFSLPFLIFTGIAKSDPSAFGLGTVASVILPTLAILILSLVLGRLFKLRFSTLGTFTQISFHGNVSYIGLAVLFYMLGEDGLRQGSVMVAVLIVANNVLATIILELTGSSAPSRHWLRPFLAVLRNPVVIASFLGVFVLFSGMRLPVMVTRSMTILANIALPMALITIGTSLAVPALKKSLKLSIIASILKLFVLPLLALFSSRIFDVPAGQASAAILLLATPAATTSYIMAQEMGGDAELASNSVTLTILLSAFTFVAWGLYLGIGK